VTSSPRPWPAWAGTLRRCCANGSAWTRARARLRSAFESVTRHDFAGQLRVPGPDPVVAYVRSMRETARLPDPEPLVEAVADRLQAAPGAVFRVTTHSGCLICA
jgi:hypothetical protein